MAKEKEDRVIIGLTSLPGGGKDYVADLLVKEYGFSKVSPGDILRKMIKKSGTGRITREFQQKIQDEYRRKYGDDYVMELCYREILASRKRRFVIPGIRFPRDAEFYRSKPDCRFINVYINAPKKLRYERLTERKREDAPRSYSEFLRQDTNEKNMFNLEKTRKISDFILNNGENESSRLKKNLERILSTVI